jgi:hypothetical protein
MNTFQCNQLFQLQQQMLQQATNEVDKLTKEELKAASRLQKDLQAVDASKAQSNERNTNTLKALRQADEAADRRMSKTLATANTQHKLDALQAVCKETTENHCKKLAEMARHKDALKGLVDRRARLLREAAQARMTETHKRRNVLRTVESNLTRVQHMDPHSLLQFQDWRVADGVDRLRAQRAECRAALEAAERACDRANQASSSYDADKKRKQLESDYKSQKLALETTRAREREREETHFRQVQRAVSEEQARRDRAERDYALACRQQQERDFAASLAFSRRQQEERDYAFACRQQQERDFAASLAFSRRQQEERDYAATLRGF